MGRSIVLPIAFALLGSTLALPLAGAQSLPQSTTVNPSAQQRAEFMWREMGECAKLSAKQFPDHTPDGNAKREAARLECLRANRLPITSQAPVISQAR